MGRVGGVGGVVGVVGVLFVLGEGVVGKRASMGEMVRSFVGVVAASWGVAGRGIVAGSSL